MPTRDTAPIGAPCWVDLTTSDTDGSQTFYRQLFGWTADEPDVALGGYVNFRKDGVRVAGCTANQPGSGPDTWSVYLATDDARKTVAAAAANGGRTLVEAAEVGDLGTMAIVSDPGGGVIGMWQPGTFHGFGVLGEPGTPGWFEVHTPDYDRAVAFYRDVFRWDTHVANDTPELRYTTLGEGYDAQAGIMDASAFLPAGSPARWTVYFMVADADATLARIVELGGSVVAPAEDTPYGRLATGADTTGAEFRLLAR